MLTFGFSSVILVDVLDRGIIKYAPLAQLVEHLTLNQGVQGSNP